MRLLHRAGTFQRAVAMDWLLTSIIHAHLKRGRIELILAFVGQYSTAPTFSTSGTRQSSSIVISRPLVAVGGRDAFGHRRSPKGEAVPREPSIDRLSSCMAQHQVCSPLAPSCIRSACLGTGGSHDQTSQLDSAQDPAAVQQTSYRSAVPGYWCHILKPL